MTSGTRKTAFEAGRIAGNSDAYDGTGFFRPNDNPYLHPLKPDLADAWADGYTSGFHAGIDARRAVGEQI